MAHYGLLPEPDDALAEAEGMLRQWAETAEIAYRAGEDIADALARRFDPPAGVVADEHRGQARNDSARGECRHPAGQFGADRRRGGLAVKDDRGHRLILAGLPSHGTINP